MKTTLERHLESAFVTFIATFFSLLGTELSVTGSAVITKTILISLIFAAIRGAFKMAYESIAGSNDIMPPISPLNDTTVAN